MQFYGDTSNYGTPYDQFPPMQDQGDPYAQGIAPPGYIDLAGLGAVHSYDHVALFRKYIHPVPIGAGGVVPDGTEELLSKEQIAYLTDGGSAPGASVWSGLGVASNQIPRWAWLTGGVGLVALGGYLTYRARAKKPTP